MRNEYKLLGIILVLNLIIALLYLLFSVLLRRKNPEKRGSYVLCFWIMVFCPVMGCGFFLLSYLCAKLLFRNSADLGDVIFSKERVKTYKKADEDKEGNMVPMEEALAVSDTGSLRSYMLNVIRRETASSLASIQLALNSRDSETAHYAASVLQQSLNDFRERIAEIQNAMEEDSENIVEYGILLMEYMEPILAQNVLDDIEQAQCVSLMSETGWMVYREAPDRLLGKHMENIINHYIEIEDYEPALEWIEKSKELYPERLESFTLPLKLYFKQGAKERFFAALEELKQSDIVINRETLELIRVLSPDAKL